MDFSLIWIHLGLAVSETEFSDDQVDLIGFIDWSGVECLNQSSSHYVINALKQVAFQFSCSLRPLSTIKNRSYMEIDEEAPT